MTITDGIITKAIPVIIKANNQSNARSAPLVLSILSHDSEMPRSIRRTAFVMSRNQTLKSPVQLVDANGLFCFAPVQNQQYNKNTQIGTHEGVTQTAKLKVR